MVSFLSLSSFKLPWASCQPSAEQEAQEKLLTEELALHPQTELPKPKKEKKKEKPSALLNTALSVGMIGAAGTSAVLIPDRAFTPYVSKMAAGTSKASAVALDGLWKCREGSCLENYAFIFKYPILACATGAGTAVDYLVTRFLKVDPQLGPTLLSSFAGAAFTDLKKKVILQKEAKKAAKKVESVTEDKIVEEESVESEVANEIERLLIKVEDLEAAPQLIESGKEKKTKKEPSVGVNLALSSGMLLTSAVSSAVAPEKVITPYLSGLTAKTMAISGRTFDAKWGWLGCSPEFLEKYGVLIKYPFLGTLAGLGFAADYALSNRVIFPVSFNPQLGPTLLTTMLGSAFDDVKRRLILKKNDRSQEKRPKTEREKPSYLLNGSLTAVSVAAATLSAAVAPQTVTTPFLVDIAAGTVKASARSLDESGEKLGLSAEKNAECGYLIKYLPLTVATGVGVLADYALSNRWIFPISFNPQLSSICGAALLGSAFNDFKRKVILKKEDDDEDF